MGKGISLCMIVKNEEKNLGRCLKSVKDVVDEIIIVDTGSSDNTVALAKEYGAKVYHYQWNDNFSEARNYSLEQAKADWILFLDADEELTSDSREHLTRYIREEQVEGYFIKIVNFIGKEGWVETCPDLVFRLFRNKPEYRFHGAIHEQIVDVILEKNSNAAYRIAEGVVINHYGYLEQQIEDKNKKIRNLRIIEKELASKPDNNILQYHYGVELFRAEKFEEAARVLVQVANKTNTNTIYFPKLLRYIVLAYYSAKQPAQALEVVQVGVSLFPNYADLYYYGGLCCLDQKSYKKAAEFFLKAVAMPEQPPQFASFAGTRGFRSYYHLGQIAEKFLNYDEALKYYLDSLKDNPNFIHSLERIIQILEPRKNPDYTRKCLEKVIDFDNNQARLALANIFYDQGAYQLCLEFIEEVIANGLVAGDILLRKAFCLIQRKRFLEALRILGELSGDNNLYPLAKFNELFCYWVQGKKKKVRELVTELCSKGLSVDTENVLKLMLKTQDKRIKTQKIYLGVDGVTLLLDIINRLLDLGQLELAWEMLNKVAPPCIEERKWELSRIFYKYGCYEKAIELIEDYLQHKRSGEAHFLLAEAQREIGNYAEAEKHYRYAIEIEPEVPQYYIKQMELYKVWQEVLRSKSLEAIEHPAGKDPGGGI
ncbi:TPR domain-containing glycosyltransferase [Desulforamulus ferrireducens]|uniref:Glycosyl transferase family 2 n=1 Tax=Desulforamulus ferrireducens TaxID=1833852 RepID=A0A1S6J0R1_9FIRM|nr:TPR domain-containing glycosyltransferase [Desulforamulus ferrireducens]AQS60611.1 glycosyl transferase family 2 [Desulforamulus ferrireducens]